VSGSRLGSPRSAWADAQPSRLSTSPKGSPRLTTFDDLPEGELENLEEEVVDQASAAKTIAALEFEIETLRSLEAIAERVRRSGTDAKWQRMAELLQDRSTELLDESGRLRKRGTLAPPGALRSAATWISRTSLARPPRRSAPCYVASRPSSEGGDAAELRPP
jgi:hypothetical protein